MQSQLLRASARFISRTFEPPAASGLLYQLERAVIRLQQSTKQIAKDLLRGELEREIVRIETSLAAVKDRLRDLG
jgi:hypothetical protein